MSAATNHGKYHSLIISWLEVSFSTKFPSNHSGEACWTLATTNSTRCARIVSDPEKYTYLVQLLQNIANTIISVNNNQPMPTDEVK